MKTDLKSQLMAGIIQTSVSEPILLPPGRKVRVLAGRILYLAVLLMAGAGLVLLVGRRLGISF